MTEPDEDSLRELLDAAPHYGVDEADVDAFYATLHGDPPAYEDDELRTLCNLGRGPRR